jgi:hypothetical protein
MRTLLGLISLFPRHSPLLPQVVWIAAVCGLAYELCRALGYRREYFIAGIATYIVGIALWKWACGYMIRRFGLHGVGAPPLSAQGLLQVVRRPFLLLKSCRHPWHLGGLIGAATVLAIAAFTSVWDVHAWGTPVGSFWWLYRGLIDGLALTMAAMLVIFAIMESTNGHPWQKVIVEVEVEKARGKALEEREIMREVLAGEPLPEGPGRRRVRI